MRVSVLFCTTWKTGPELGCQSQRQVLLPAGPYHSSTKNILRIVMCEGRTHNKKLFFAF